MLVGAYRQHTAHTDSAGLHWTDAAPARRWPPLSQIARRLPTSRAKDETKGSPNHHGLSAAALSSELSRLTHVVRENIRGRESRRSIGESSHLPTQHWEHALAPTTT